MNNSKGPLKFATQTSALVRQEPTSDGYLMEVTASPTAARMLKDFEVGDGSNSVSRDHRGPQGTTKNHRIVSLGMSGGHLPGLVNVAT